MTFIPAGVPAAVMAGTTPAGFFYREGDDIERLDAFAKIRGTRQMLYSLF